MIPVTMTGMIMFAVYVRNEIWKAPASTRLVGFDDTRIAEAGKAESGAKCRSTRSKMLTNVRYGKLGVDPCTRMLDV